MHDYPLEHWTIGRILADKSSRVPQRTFLIWKGERFTYAEVELLTNRFANGLADYGVRKGDHVAVMLPNCPEMLWVLWGLGKLGAVGVPINTSAKGDMLRYFLDQSDSTMIIADTEFVVRLSAVISHLRKVKRVFLRASEANRFDLPVCEAPVGDFYALCSENETPPPENAVAHDDVHLIMYTSGTTGPSKGVLCPHSQGHAIGRLLVQDFGYCSDDVLYTCLPLFHANAIWYSVYAALWADASVALAPRFSASRFWGDIHECGATQFNTLGAMTNIIWKLPPSELDQSSRLKQCMAVPVPREIYHEFQGRYQVTLTSVFAMTETFAMTRFRPDDSPAKAGSAGSPHDAASLRIVNDVGEDLPCGEVGEILMMPRIEGALMKGYYKMPAETERAFSNGWFRTGDRGYLDSEGYLYFVDRKKEAIRRRGENISAYEVELILSRHESILEVAAIPVASDVSEDDVMVYVVPRDGHSISEADVIHFAIEHMSYFMVPRYVQFAGELPKTASEKIEKYKLKLDAEARRDQLWDREKHGIEVRR